MPAPNITRVRRHIESMIKVCDTIVDLDKSLRQVAEEQEALTQVWDDLETDFPGMFESGNPETTSETPALTDRIWIGTVQQDFSGDDVKKVKNHFDQLLNALDGVDPIGGGAAKRGRAIRALATETGI